MRVVLKKWNFVYFLTCLVTISMQKIDLSSYNLVTTYAQSVWQKCRYVVLFNIFLNMKKMYLSLKTKKLLMFESSRSISAVKTLDPDNYGLGGPRKLVKLVFSYIQACLLKLGRGAVRLMKVWNWTTNWWIMNISVCLVENCWIMNFLSV